MSTVRLREQRHQIHSPSYWPHMGFMMHSISRAEGLDVPRAPSGSGGDMLTFWKRNRMVL